MALQISISNAIGARAVAGGGGVDPDAQAFITAAAITDPTQQSAINQLVVDLKGYSIWSKMSAIYPFCGGSASSHKFNLKDPRDLDAAFRLVFSGGVTHSSTGATFNGTNGFADTKLASNGVLAQNSTHFSAYSRTNNQSGGYIVANGNANASGECKIFTRWFDNNCYSGVNTFGQVPTANSDSRGYFIVNRISATQHSVVIRGTKTDFNTNSSGLNTNTFRICSAISTAYDNKEVAFASIGDGLSNTELSNLNTAVQAFQTTLGRSIGTQTVSDADAQAFVTAANIVDQVEANAINNLVIGLKADSLWTKMKACYPMVGGSSSTMKFNLKNPLDTDAAFRLTYSGGLTYSSTGLLGGVNGYADTKLVPSSVLSLNNTHISFYSRTDNAGFEDVEMGVNDGSNTSRLFIAPKYSGSNSAFRAVNSAQAGPGTSPNMQGFFIASRVNSTAMKLYRNSSVLFNDSTSSGLLNSTNIFLLCYNNSGTPVYYSDRECAFASIGDGLDDTEATNLTNRVQTFNTALNRNV
jgi:hypothetical protein